MSSLFDILVMSEFCKMAKCTKLVPKSVSSKNHPKFDILVMSEFFKMSKWAKFVRNWVSPKNHPKFDILAMSDFFKTAKCTKFVWNWVSSKNHPKFDILVMSEFYNIRRCFWCNAAEFTKKSKSPVPFPPDFWGKLNFVRILCIWLFWKTLRWLPYRRKYYGRFDY